MANYDTTGRDTRSDTNRSDTTRDDTIKLDQFLKWAGVAQTGGEAKMLIQSGEVQVNGAIETRRGRKLVEGDRVSLLNQTFTVSFSGV